MSTPSKIAKVSSLLALTTKHVFRDMRQLIKFLTDIAAGLKNVPWVIFIIYFTSEVPAATSSL